MDVLIVEDDPNLRGLWRTILRERVSVVHEADSVSTAREKLESDRIRLMFLDLYLGAESGLGLARTAAAKHPECDIVIVTGSSRHSRAELFELGPHIREVLCKPVDIETIQQVCDRMLSAPKTRRFATEGTPADGSLSLDLRDR